MRIGDKQGRRPFLTPDNKGLAKRANERIEHLAASANSRTETALRVDGVQLLVWNRILTGNLLCSCSRRQDGPESDAGDHASYEVVGTSTILPGDSGRAAIPPTNRKVVDTRTNLFTAEDDEDWNFLHGEDKKRGSGKVDHEPDFSDIADDDPADDPSSLSEQFSKDFLTGETIKCPVCAGTTFVDSWRPRGGQRLVMSFLDTDDFDTDGDLDVTARPYMLTLKPGQYVTWKMKMPKYYSAVHSARLWQSMIPVTALVTANGAVMSPRTLLRMAGTPAARDITFRYVAPTKTLLTHFDMVLTVADLPYGQLPQIDLPYAREFHDYNTQISIEMAANISLYPGDLLCDFKYQRMWRVTSATRRQTGEGRTLPQTVECRLVSVVEPFSLLSPFDHIRDIGEKQYRSMLEKWQSGTR